MALSEVEMQIYAEVECAINKLSKSEFCLDKSFYEQFGIQASVGVRKKIGKHFKKQVKYGNVKNVKCDPRYHGCGKCDYKDVSNKMHYVKQ